MTSSEPIKKKSYIAFGFLSLFFGYLVTKEVEIPTVVIAGLAAIGAIILFIQGLSRPELVTYTLIVYLPYSRDLAGDFAGAATALNFTNLLMIFIIFVWLSGKYSAGEKLWLKTPLNAPIILFLLLGFIAVIRGNYFGPEYIGYALIEYKRWTTPFFLYFLVINTVKDKDMIKNVTIMIAIVTTTVGLMAIYDYFDLGNVSSLEKARIGGIANQPNMLAAFFNYYMFIPFGFFLMNMGKIQYWSLLIPFAICFRGIMVTFSRGGYLAFALGLYAIVFFRNKGLFILMLFATLVVWSNPVLLPGGVRYRMGQTFTHETSYVEDLEGAEESLESSAQTRVHIWRAGMQMVKDYPFWGVGYGLFSRMLHYYIPGELKATDPHNQYLMIAAEMGIPALIVFMWIILAIIFYTYRLYRNTKDPFSKALALGFLGGLFGLLMSNMFGSRLDSQEIASYLWILAALIMRLRIIEGREENPAKAAQKIGYRLPGNAAL